MNSEQNPYLKADIPSFEAILKPFIYYVVHTDANHSCQQIFSRVEKYSKIWENPIFQNLCFYFLQKQDKKDFQSSRLFIKWQHLLIYKSVAPTTFFERFW